MLDDLDELGRVDRRGGDRVLLAAGVLELPLAGQTDQLVKLLTAADVKALLYGEECRYLGVTVSPMTKEEGGLG